MEKRVAIYAISDLHLSFNKSVDIDRINPENDITKPMELFGWEKHYDRIRDNWRKLIKDTDTVLIPGDISWALKLETAMNDLQWIEQLPGRKVLSPGNHEYYYHSKNKIRKVLPSNMEWIDADYTVVEGKVVCATRGWTLPTDRNFNETEDRKIYDRQIGRLRLSLETAVAKQSGKDIIVMLHYPPLNKTGGNSGFWELMKQYNVKYCIYGHLHGKAIHEAVEGYIDGIQLKLVSCDALQFCPIAIME
ncbi:metallophosphoesterase [Shimazuella sp. AN120528]|uniref:metallophosphoesterase n=1 Tax=Shimazuella soli TaxID=1892854 RepID=UPI001F109D3B|nr:metallophosphoesterase [Shimazuella soli]MCH5584151.1 metallophosphoesterase [Shimazuella soli]